MVHIRKTQLGFFFFLFLFFNVPIKTVARNRNEQNRSTTSLLPFPVFSSLRTRWFHYITNPSLWNRWIAKCRPRSAHRWLACPIQLCIREERTGGSLKITKKSLQGFLLFFSRPLRYFFFFSHLLYTCHRMQSIFTRCPNLFFNYFLEKKKNSLNALEGCFFRFGGSAAAAAHIEPAHTNPPSLTTVFFFFVLRTFFFSFLFCIRCKERRCQE